MPRIMGITIPAGLEIYYNKTLKMYDFSFFCSIGKNPRFLTRSRYYSLREISYLFAIANSWSGFGAPQKQSWLDAGDVPGINGYNLFVQDQAYRIKNLLGGFATPSSFHQYLVGHINLAGSATAYKIGKTNDPDRRVMELNQPSNEQDLIWRIETDDPVGVEKYWHDRFELKRLYPNRTKHEWFKLNTSDVKAFKRWKKIA